MKYLYLVYDSDYEDFEKAIQRSGSNGWELIHIIPMQQITGRELSGMPRMKAWPKCVFKKPEPDA